MEKTKAEKYPDLWAAFQKLQARREEILKAHEPLRAEQSALVAQQAELQKKVKEIVEKVKVDRPELADIDVQLSGLARAMGGEALNS